MSIAAKPKSDNKKKRREMMVYGNAIRTETAIYTIVDHLGSGGFGDVYKVYRNEAMDEFYALKTEEYNVPGRLNRLKMEAEVLLKCTDEPKPHFIRLVDKGRTAELKFIIMTMVGPTLDKVRASCPNRNFGQQTAIKVCIQLLESLRDLHNMRYLHRDLKPSNFAIGLHDPQRATIFMLDFGIAKPYMGKDGQLLLPRSKVAFMGTLRFAPVAAHMLKDQNRRDDLESLLYVMADIFNEKNLLWRGHKNVAMLINFKQSFLSDMGDEVKKILDTLPPGYREVLKYVKQLAPDCQPAYDLLINSMSKEVKDLAEPLDWMTSNMGIEEQMPKKTAMATVVKSLSLSTVKDGLSVAKDVVSVPSNPKTIWQKSAKSQKGLKKDSQKSLKKVATATNTTDKKAERKAALAAILVGHEEARKKVMAERKPGTKSTSRMDRAIAEHDKKQAEEAKKKDDQ